MENKSKLNATELPQTFVVKFLGRSPARGLWGIKNTREPVDRLVTEAKSANLPLPIVHLTVSPLGIQVSHLPEPFSENSCPDKDSTRLLDCNDNELPQKKQKKILGKLVFMKCKKISPKISEQKENIQTHSTDFTLLEKLKCEYKFRADMSFFGIDAISYGVQDLVYTRVFSVIVVAEDEVPRFYCYSFVCHDQRTARNLTYALAAAFQMYSRTLKGTKATHKLTPVKSMKPNILSIDMGGQFQDSEA